MAGPSGSAYMRKDGDFMKAMKRRLLSLLLAMAMVCSLVPSALAADTLTVTAQASSGLSVTKGSSLDLARAVTVSVTDPSTGSAVTGAAISYSLTNGTETGVDLSNGVLTVQNTATASSVAVTVTATKDGATGSSAPITVTITGGGTQAAASISLSGVTGNQSPYSATYIAGSGPYYVTASVLSSSDVAITGATITGVESTVPSICSVSHSGNTITLTPSSNSTANGNTTIRVYYNTITAIINVNVSPSNLPTFTINASSLSIASNGQAALTIPYTTSTGVSMPSYTNVEWKITSGGTLAHLYASTGSSNTLIGDNKATGGTVTVKATLLNGTTPVAEGTVNIAVGNATPVKITLQNYNGFNTANNTFSSYGAQAYAYASVDGYTGNQGIYYYWTKTDSNSSGVVSLNGNGTSPIMLTAVNTGYSTIRVQAYEGASTTGKYLGEATVRVDVGYSYALNPKVTVNSGSSSYNLSDTDDVGGASVLSQISSYVGTYLGSYPYVRFTQTTSNVGNLEASTTKNYYLGQAAPGAYGSSYGYFSDIYFVPKTSGTATFAFDVYSNGAVNYSGLLTVVVSGDTIGDIPYTASIGDDVYFDLGDFEDFYYTKTSRGTLDRVSFTLPSGGNLYADGGRLNTNNVCYASPRSNQNDLSTVYFSPTGTTASRAGTVRINFTAYGNKGNVSGTVAVTYLNGAAKDINYSAINGSVTLNPQDFINAYKEVTGKTAPSGLTIQFQEAPVNGTLTYTGGSRDVVLTRNNVRSNKYATKTTGSYRLDQLVYSGTRGTDTIEYIAYNGGAAQFTGKVVFNGAGAVPTDVVVTYGSVNGQAVTFSQNDFIRANSAISNAAKLRFVASSNGTLTMNGANAAGVDVLPSMLGSVSYKPRAGFNGTDKIIFAAYDARGNVVASGNVNITVVGNSGGGNTGGSTGGVTDVSQFKDVSSSAWYRSDLATLVSQGIITGKGEGKFDPLGTVTYGEALKMILEACGHTAALGTGSNWAINYKNLAVSNGWISSSIDLNAAISRNATAELAAKVMGVAPATGSSPFADDANAYAVALYYTSPQIFVGDNTTGKLLFKNGSPLLRQEVCAVICRVRNYHTQHNANTMPDGV